MLTKQTGLSIFRSSNHPLPEPRSLDQRGDQEKETQTMKTLKAILSAPSLSLVALALAILVLVSMTWVQPSHADESQLNCGPRDVAVAELAGDLGERVIGRGLSQNGKAMVEIFKSESGSWTVIVTDTNGVSCILANGQVWMNTQSQPDNYVSESEKN